MKRTLTYKFEAGEHPTLQAVRITVSTVTMSGIGKHARMLREAVEQWRQDTGQEPDQEEPNGQEERIRQGNEEAQEGLLVPPAAPTEAEKAERNWLYSQYTRWAILAATTAMVSVIQHGKKGKTVELDDNQSDDWPWQESSLAALGWDNPKGVGELPVDLFTAWEAQSMAVNPGIFGPPQTGANGKKKGGLVQIV